MGFGNVITNLYTFFKAKSSYLLCIRPERKL